MAKTAGRALTKGLIYGLMFLVLFAFVGIPLEQLILILLPGWSLPTGTVPLILGAFGLFGSIALAFADYVAEEEPSK